MVVGANGVLVRLHFDVKGISGSGNVVERVLVSEELGKITTAVRRRRLLRVSCSFLGNRLLDK